ncbi:unnamed protein product [Lampetra planeri]
MTLAMENDRTDDSFRSAPRKPGTAAAAATAQTVHGTRNRRPSSSSDDATCAADAESRSSAEASGGQRPTCFPVLASHSVTDHQ